MKILISHPSIKAAQTSTAFNTSICQILCENPKFEWASKAREGGC